MECKCFIAQPVNEEWLFPTCPAIWIQHGKTVKEVAGLNGHRYQESLSGGKMEISISRCPHKSVYLIDRCVIILLNRNRRYFIYEAA